MKTPLFDARWHEVDEVDSTQDLAASLIKQGERPGIVLAHHQVAGRGRLGRTWISQRDDSLTVSMVFWPYADHPRPYLVGMSVAVAVAGAVHVKLRWPNDLIVDGRKVGGILTELVDTPSGSKVPVVGLGINLNQSEFPAELLEIATSLATVHGGVYDPKSVLQKVLTRLERLPEPRLWADLAPIWAVFDNTPGKLYKLPDGNLALAAGIGSDGQLLCSVDGETQTVLAAEAIFG